MNERLAETKALRARLAYLESIVENSPDIISRFDRDLRHVYVNRAIEAASGAPRDSFLGKDHYELGMPEALVEPWREVYREVFATGREGRKEFEFVAADGSVRSYVSRVVPEFDAEGAVVTVLSLARDVTDWKRAEEQRLEVERRLSQTNKLESLGILAGGLAHDFNNLLTGVLAGASLLRQAGVSPELGRRVTEQIESAALRASELCSQMLAFAGRGQISLGVVELGELAEETVSLVASSIPRNVAVVVERHDRGRYVNADATQLRQVLMNLVLNAAESILPERPGAVRVRVEVVERDDVSREGAIVAPVAFASSYVRLSVRDDGTGFDEATRARMFDPFFTTKFQGRGLGLSAVLGMTQRHGGVLHVESVPNQGTTFLLHLPETGDRPVLNAARTSREVPLLGTVLIVDDDPTVRAAVDLMARAIGLRPVVASSGPEAIERVESARDTLDLALLDVTMPGMDGFETLRAIRQIRPDLPVILTSGYSARVAANGPDVRYDVFLQKPYRAEDLRAAVLQALPKREGTEPPFVAAPDVAIRRDDLPQV